MNFLVAIVLIPILGIAASAPSKSDVIQVSSSEDMDDDENSVSTTPSPRDDCTKGCQILVVDTSEADKRCQGNVRLVPLLEGDPVYLALEGTECRPGTRRNSTFVVGVLDQETSCTKIHNRMSR
ncbi:uncharacterized protein LOC124277217 [Haliotis rubra]|uniref:uncharacterized protein LOC124277217 n=1 Tax=Haliotis rubra TaxID=36100 RepID=UPI001EE63145|nr:uncharacterized protein LOC124277217 [Haliotis rubra]